MIRAANWQAIRKMAPGTLGGQTWSATPVAQHKPHRRIVRPSTCPRHISGRPYDYGTLNPDATELWFPRFFGIEAWDYPALTGSLFTVVLGGGTPNRGALTLDPTTGTFYIAADFNILSIDAVTHSWTYAVFGMTDPVFGLVWHPLDGLLYGISWDGSIGSFVQIDPVGGTVTTLVAGPTNGFAAPTNYNGSGTDYPLVATDNYVVSAYDATQTSVDLFIWDVANATSSTVSVLCDGAIPTPVADQIIAGRGSPTVYDLTSPSGTPVATVNTTTPLLTCPVFASGFFDDGFSRSATGKLEFNDGSDIWEFS